MAAIGSRLPAQGQGSDVGKASLLPRVDQLILQFDQAGKTILSASESIQSNGEKLAAEANEILFNSQIQAAATNEVRQVMDDFASHITNVSGLARDSEVQSRDATEQSIQGEAVVQEAVGKMTVIAETMARSSTQVLSLTQHAQEIGKVTGVISEIAKQTNLLALNAAIEAARAGEQGRGFAVVADEVRGLAERTAKATQEISQMIHQIQDETHESVDGIVQAKNLAEEGVTMANHAADVLRSMRQGAQATLDKISSVATEMEEQSNLVENVAAAVLQVLDLAAQTDVVAERALLISNDLAQLAVVHSETVGQWREG